MDTINLDGKAYITKFITKLQRCFQNRSSYEFRNIYRKTPVLESFINKAAGLKDCNFIKKRLQHCEYWEISKNSFFCRIHRVTASVL